jgi:hypothetical protein
MSCPLITNGRTIASCTSKIQYEKSFCICHKQAKFLHFLMHTNSICCTLTYFQKQVVNHAIETSRYNDVDEPVLNELREKYIHDFLT